MFTSSTRTHTRTHTDNESHRGDNRAACVGRESHLWSHFYWLHVLSRVFQFGDVAAADDPGPGRRGGGGGYAILEVIFARAPRHTHAHAHALSPMFTDVLTHTQTDRQTYAHTYAHTHPPTQSHTHSHTQEHTHTHTVNHTVESLNVNSLSLSLSLSLLKFMLAVFIYAVTEPVRRSARLQLRVGNFVCTPLKHQLSCKRNQTIALGVLRFTPRPR